VIWALLVAGLAPGCASGCDEDQICVIAGTGALGFNGDQLPALETRIASPTDVGMTPDGRIWFADFSNMRVRLIEEDATITTLAGIGTHGYSQQGALRLETPLENPIDAAFDADGRLHILPLHEGRVIRVDDDDRIEPVLGSGIFGDSSEGSDSTYAQMGYCSGLAFGPDGSLYVSDSIFSRVRRLNPDGTFETVLGTGAGGISPMGLGRDVLLHGPERLVVDESRDRLLVADTQNHRVLALDLDTNEVTVIAGTGEQGYGGDRSEAISATLREPVGVEVTDAGVVVIADLGNNVLRAVGADGNIHTVVGPSTLHAFEMHGPAGLGWTPEGDLLIAERSGHRILQWKGAIHAL
jgi:sugar lactone lactonase YvrE